MAADATGISRAGQRNATGDARLLLLQVWSGELLMAFERFNFINTMVMKKQIRGAKIVDWRAMGRISGGFHTVGNHVFEDGEADAFNHVKRPVELDDLLLAATLVDNLDTLRAEFSEREPYMTELGRYLATTYDQYGLIALGRGARTNITNSANLVPADMTGGAGDGGFVGNVDLSTGTSSEKGGVLLDAYFTAQQLLDEKDIAEEDRFAPARPAHYNYLVRNRELLDRDFGNEGNGVFFDGTVFVAGGFGLIKTNNIPSETLSVNPTGANNTYTGLFGAHHTTLFHRSALGIVEMLAPRMDVDWYPEYRSHGLIAEMSQGTAPVRYEACVELSSAASQPSL